MDVAFMFIWILNCCWCWVLRSILTFVCGFICSLGVAAVLCYLCFVLCR